MLDLILIEFSKLWQLAHRIRPRGCSFLWLGRKPEHLRWCTSDYNYECPLKAPYTGCRYCLVFAFESMMAVYAWGRGLVGEVVDKNHPSVLYPLCLA